MTRLQFFVPGTPQPQGSKRAFVVAGRAVVTEQGGERFKSWRTAITDAAVAAYSASPYRGPVCVRAEFRFARPKSHLTSKGALTKSAPRIHVSKPDLDKLVRTVLDALTGVVIHDDSQVCWISAQKDYADPGVQVVVTMIEQEP